MNSRDEPISCIIFKGLNWNALPKPESELLQELALRFAFIWLIDDISPNYVGGGSSQLGYTSTMAIYQFLWIFIPIIKEYKL